MEEGKTTVKSRTESDRRHNYGGDNMGSYNCGSRNVGSFNSGDCNVGDYNKGDFNIGDWNLANNVNGCFCTVPHCLYFFNKESHWDYDTWYFSQARYVLEAMPTDHPMFVPELIMGDKEKKEHPNWEADGGYWTFVKDSNKRQEWWDSLEESEKQAVREMPNFDADIFKRITGIEVWE